MSAQISQTADIGSVAAPPAEADQADDPFPKFVEEVLASNEIRGDLGVYPQRRGQLRDHLQARQADLIGGVSAERKRWKDAAERAAHPRDAVQEDKKVERTWVYRFFFIPLLVLLVASFCSAILCLGVGYLVASSRPSLASWRPAGLISVAVCVGTFFVAVLLAQLNISWVANREAGTYNNAANLAWSEYARSAAGSTRIRIRLATAPG